MSVARPPTQKVHFRFLVAAGGQTSPMLAVRLPAAARCALALLALALFAHAPALLPAA